MTGYNPIADVSARLGKPMPEAEYVAAYPETANPRQEHRCNCGGIDFRLQIDRGKGERVYRIRCANCRRVAGIGLPAR